MKSEAVTRILGKFFRHPLFVLILIFLVCLVLQCGYLESVVSPVESSTTTLGGRIVDHLSKEGITNAKIILSGLRDTVVYSKDNGLFQFPLATTGMKQITVEAAGYHQYRDSIDLLLDPNMLDSIFIERHNHAPTIHGMIFPVTTPAVDTLPVTIQFSWTVSDVDFANPISKEGLRYLFYFGETNLALIDEGPLNLDECIPDTISLDTNRYIVNKPDSLFSRLKTGTMYKWKIVVKDVFKDSSVYQADSFITRQAFTEDSCPSDMVLVEMDTLSFCMDKFEFTVGEYYQVDNALVRDTVYMVYFVNKDTVFDKYLDSLLDTVIYVDVDTGQFYPYYKDLAPDTLVVYKDTTLSKIDTAEKTKRYIDSLSRYSHPDEMNQPVLDRPFSSAELACQTMGKRLCTISEWQAASGGYRKLKYPYSNIYDSTKCHTNVDMNDAFGSRPVDVGSMDSCFSVYGVYDLSGNVSEWVTCRPAEVASLGGTCFDPNEGWQHKWFAGGFWSSKENSGTNTFNYTIIEQGRFDIGFRCCKDIK
jgi:formylglycine-generating enzyme required for sulfatase activity